MCIRDSAWLVQRAYPHAELSLSCPRLRPIAGNGSLGPRGVGERQLLQVMCAYRLLLPQAGITISSRERAGFRDQVMGIAATKISAGVSTGVGAVSYTHLDCGYERVTALTDLLELL